jgi:type III restriction enzyme
VAEPSLHPEEATRRIRGANRIHNTLRSSLPCSLREAVCADRQDEFREGLFDWIISDFGLSDANKAGLVKTPPVVVRDGIIPMPDVTAAALSPGWQSGSV